MDDLNKKLDKYVKLSQEQRQKKLRWLFRQSEELQLEAFVLQKKYYFELSKYKDENQSLLYLAACTLAAREIYDLLKMQKGKNRSQNIYSVKNPTSMQAKQLKKYIDSDKWDKLLNLKNKILVLKDQEGLSYRQISNFLHRYHRLEVSHSYVATFIKKMKG